jgi:NAD(P)H dehydrogenase (quinone)
MSCIFTPDIEGTMKVLIVYAHPEPRSLNGALKDFALTTLTQKGHEIRVSDLYASNWKARLDRDDFPDFPPEERLVIGAASKRAFTANTLTQDVRAEQEKLLWADAVILQFPLWWFTMPAVLKGWVERVYAYGFGYGVGEHSDQRWGDRYGEGTLTGKRAMLSVTLGGWADHYSEHGINGPIDDVLFPINHGILFYPGFDVLPPFVVYRADSTDETRYRETLLSFEGRLDSLFTASPIQYRRQNSGDYEIPSLTLKHGAASLDHGGFRLHIHSDDDQRPPLGPHLSSRAMVGAV